MGLHVIANIIPQQETSGNYNLTRIALEHGAIIPQQETSGRQNRFEENYLGHFA